MIFYNYVKFPEGNCHVVVNAKHFLGTWIAPNRWPITMDYSNKQYVSIIVPYHSYIASCSNHHFLTIPSVCGWTIHIPTFQSYPLQYLPSISHDSLMIVRVLFRFLSNYLEGPWGYETQLGGATMII